MKHSDVLSYQTRKNIMVLHMAIFFVFIFLYKRQRSQHTYHDGTYLGEPHSVVGRTLLFAEGDHVEFVVRVLLFQRFDELVSNHSAQETKEKNKKNNVQN